MITRRALLTAFSAGAIAAPFAVLAQAQGKTPRIGFFYLGSRQSAAETGRYNAFVQGMQVAAGISSILAVIVAIVAVTLLRNIRPSSNDEGGTEPTDDLAGTSDRSRPPALGMATAVAEA